MLTSLLCVARAQQASTAAAGVSGGASCCHRAVCWLCAQVIPQGDGYWCEHDSKSYESMERRYVLRVQAADFTGEHYLALFNDQVML